MVKQVKPAIESISVEEFARTAGAHLKSLRKTGEPKFLTHRGKVGAVVLTPASYKRLVEDLKDLEAEDGLRRGIEQSIRGEGVDAEEFVKSLRKKYARRSRANG